MVKEGLEKQFFKVNASKYVQNKTFDVYRPASLDNPKNNSVMFITEKYIDRASVFETVKECLIFWPASQEVPSEIQEKNAVCIVNDTHNQFANFFKENSISNLPQPEECAVVNGAFIEKGAVIGQNCTIFPGSYIGTDVTIGDNVYIGSGVKLLGIVSIGNNVVIRENTVIGADGLTTDRDATGKAITLPQFGGVVIHDDVQIGANTVIARGAIDDTEIGRGSKIDSCTFISHNVHIGEDSFVVGETIMFGSSSVGDRVLISGNCTLSNYTSVGDDSVLGQAALVTKSIPAGKIAIGSPAKVVRDK